MTVAVVQASSTNTFASNVTAGNTVVLAVQGGDASNVTLTSTNPSLGPSTPAGSFLCRNTQSAYTNGFTSYAAVWVMPNCPGGFNNFGVTLNPTGSAEGGVLAAWELSGLGLTPVTDRTAAGTGFSSNVDTGATLPIRASAEFIAGVMGTGAGASTSPAGWTITNAGSNQAGYQIASASGGTYDWAQTLTGNGTWAAVVATIAAVLPPVVPPTLGGGKSMLGRSMRWADL